MTRPLRVLLVDDSLIDRELAETAFELLRSPCTLETVDSGSAALQRLLQPEATMPDVILLDINMPGMTGFEVLSTFKTHPQLSVIPVVMLTTSAQTDDVTRAYTLHASAYLLKSIHFQTFLEQMEKLIEFWMRARLTTWPQMISI
ncbi:response regulator [Deinococcus sp. QL22]|uniref:response regulator n=1 Tax=Deinococcus sp. QL22 TaxID=2939437 RepID=UPI002017F3DC|nr:response regulator [Deinococcus sp. QL22]UQN10101.1 response regulator [Deinococcus sp. QL22]